jgi:hypothetical protein
MAEVCWSPCYGVGLEAWGCGTMGTFRVIRGRRSGSGVRDYAPSRVLVAVAARKRGEEAGSLPLVSEGGLGLDDRCLR